MHLIAGNVTSLPGRSRDVTDNDESSAASRAPEAVSTPEVVSALRSMTSPFHDVIMAAGPLLFPLPFLHPPILSLSDLASYQDARSLPETARPWNGAVDCASGNGSGNETASCDDDSDEAGCDVGSATPLDLSPPRTERVDNFPHHGNYSRS